MRLVAVIILVITAAVSTRCTKDVETTPVTTTSTTATLVTEKVSNCQTLISVEDLQNRDVQLPAIGKLVNEDHHTTRGMGTPKSTTDGINNHLIASCGKLNLPTAKDCSDVYKVSYQKRWTPAENGGRIGDGAISLKPTLEEEIWLFNMYWSAKKRPPPGYKYLVTNPANGRSVVVSGGYEVGPASSYFLGGISTEGHYYLKANNETLLRVARLKDQSTKLGPITCEVK